MASRPEPSPGALPDAQRRGASVFVASLEQNSTRAPTRDRARLASRPAAPRNAERPSRRSGLRAPDGVAHFHRLPPRPPARALGAARDRDQLPKPNSEPDFAEMPETRRTRRRAGFASDRDRERPEPYRKSSAKCPLVARSALAGSRLAAVPTLDGRTEATS